MGAMAQSIPDLDFVASFWLDTTDDLLAHRGFTHSFLFVLLVSPLLAMAARRTVKPFVNMSSWSVFFVVEMFIHLFLDAFNNYGVGWFEPFSHYRVSFNTVYVADPLITIFPLIATIVLLFIPARRLARRKWWFGALSASSAYLVICIFNKVQIQSDAKTAFARQNIPHQQYFTTPAPLQSLLWMVVAGDGKGFHVGFRSVFDSDPEITFQYFPTNEHLLSPVSHHRDVTQLKRFSQGFYTVEQWGDTIVFNDLRFGQIIGWHDPREKFVFHYFLQHPESNELVVQRGRFAKWDREVFMSFLRRIRGN